MLYDEVCLASRKRIGEKKIDAIAPRGTLGVRCPTLKMLCGALTSILVFFFPFIFWINISIWATAHLPLPLPYPNCWVRGWGRWGSCPDTDIDPIFLLALRTSQKRRDCS